MLTHLERVLGDSTDRASWLKGRETLIGASDAAKYARVESVNLYADDKVNPRHFSGNATTANGNRWEPMLLSYVGIPQNTLLFHHPDERGFGATPDGLRPLGADTIELAEIKTKHNKIVSGPTPAELRQVAWQLFVMPEAARAVWAWGEVVQVHGEWELREGSPKQIVYERTDPTIITVQNQLIPIATAVLAEVRRRRELAERAGF